ncbi:MAG: 3-phosphoserine/phosphohydroxythreonine transaminase [Gallionella sp.]|jgi:phosphoserine aminotransferase|nr:3-phosphoserine/phosphohydroxythreonine transaminase [Gallionella sp.]
MTIYNFSAGPAVLPKAVLQQAQAELADWHGSGMSVMEMSHRGKEYMGIHAQAEADLRELMGIPANYKVLFLQGGAHLQFSMIPLNLLRGKTSADYVYTGEWSKKAIGEAKKFASVNVVVDNKDRNSSYVPAFETWQRDPNAAYLHYTPNETIGGVEFNWIPETGDVPLVADMSSNILSRVIDVSKFGLIYAGAQKNIGPAGLTLVIVREDLIGQVTAGTPTMLDYKTHADNDSMYNTPPTFAIYMAGLVFQWLKSNGGIAAMEQANIAKANLLYGAIDASGGFYSCPVDPADRSRMNVPFTLRDAALDGDFLKQADARGLLQLKGHRSVGGMRASIYNAMPLEGVQALVEFMNEFARGKA